jgi:hypothetical protein
MEIQPSEKSNTNNYIFDRLILTLETAAFSHVPSYSAYMFKKAAEGIYIFNETEWNKINQLMSYIRTYYIDEVKCDIDKFIKKYDLENKLKVRSEFLIHELIMEDLKIRYDLKSEEKLFNLFSSKNLQPGINPNSEVQKEIIKHYTHNFIKQKCSKLEEEIKEMKIRLEELKKLNCLNLKN